MVYRSFSITLWAVLILGGLANLFFWPTAKAWMCLAVALLIFSGSQKVWKDQISTLLLWALAASGLWAVLNWFDWLGFIVFILWILFLIGWFNREHFFHKDKPYPMSLPSRFWAGVFSTIFIAACVLLHLLINFYLAKPFQLSWWNSILFAHVAFLLFYPQKLLTCAPADKKRLNIILSILIILILVWHGVQSRILSNSTDTIPPDQIAQTSFEKGYYELGINFTIQHCQNLLADHQWQDAVQFMRAQFVHFNHLQFAETLREQEDIENPFFYAMCFGMQLNLESNETALDFSILEGHEIIHILTNHRLIAISNEAIQPIRGFDHAAVSMAVHHLSQQGAILTEQSIEFFWTNRPSVPLDADRVWVDVEFFSENKLWLLDATGQVEQFILSDNQQWTYDKQLFPALWGEPEYAQDLLPFPDQEACYLLDRYGGVHLWGKINEIPPDKDLLNYHYHPERPIMRDLDYGGKWSELMLLNSSGWIFFLLSDRPHMQVLFPRGEAVAMEPVFNLDTVYQLQTNGRIVPYILPQGAYISIYEGFHHYSIGE